MVKFWQHFLSSKKINLLMVTTNLIDAYDQMMDFIAKHTLDRFHLIGDQSVSLRSLISRELVSNILVHREYTSAYPAKIIIERDRIVTENWNLPKAPGHIDPNDFEPFPKNPILSRFFIQLSRADVLGSGVRNLYRYTELYSGGTPELIDGDVFRTMVPLNKENFILSDKQPTGEKVTDRVTDEVTDRVTNHEKELINLLIENPKYSFTELSDKLEVSRKTISKRMKLLKERQLIERVGTNKRGYWKVLYK